MKRYGKILTVMVLTVLLIMTSMLSYADKDTTKDAPADVAKTEIAEKMVEKNFDSDNNKLFDNLEQKMNEKNDTEKIPVIVIYEDQADDAAKANVKANVKNAIKDAKIKHEFTTIPGMATELTKAEIKELSKMDGVKQIEFDAPVKAYNDKATYWFGADKAVTDFGVNGDRDGNVNSYSKDDIVVAVIDTGIDANHVDLDGGKVIGWKDYVNNQSTPYDDHGHGTHCASTIAGTGDGNPLYKGVASGAALVGVKVLDSTGNGTMSDVTAGIDWVVANKATYGVEVISLSLGAAGSSDGTDSTSLAVNNAFNNGIVVCVAAGNEGPGRYTIGAPGAAAKAITVGAMADVGELGYHLAYFSSRGPTADGRTKPDIAAPGYYITAAAANTTNGYATMSGTSMATPFTAGTAALMLDANPSLTPQQVKDKITGTAKDWGPTGQDIDYGFGRLDSYEAIKSAGGYTGTNIAIPNHMYKSEDLSAKAKSDYYTVDVTSTTYPIAITLIMPNWSNSRTPDFDIYLYNPSGTQVASATSSTRQETIRFQPTTTGTYTIRVYSYTGSGSYYFDLSTGGSNLVMTQDQ